MAEETPEERKRRLEFTANVVRSGLFASSGDILEQLTAAKIPDVAPSMMTGAAMFAAELTHNTIKGLGGDVPAARKWLVDSVGAYFDRYCEMAVQEAASAIIANDPAIQ